MAEAPSITSLFGDIVSPEAVRQQQEAQDMALGKYMAENVGSAGMLNLPSHARNVMRSIGGITGAETRSPAEIKAAENQKLFGSLMKQASAQYPNSRADQLDFVAKQLQAKGKIQEAMRAQDAATQARQQEADLDATKAQAEQRRAAAEASQAQAGKAKAETTTEEETRQGKVDELAAKIAKENALAAKAGKEKEKTAEEIATIIAERDPNVDLIEARKAAENALKEQREAETKLKGAELSRFEAMTPLEIIKTNTEIAKNTADYKVASERLTTIGKTDFDKLLENSDLSQEDKDKYRNMRIEALARTGSTQGFDIQGQAEEYAFGTYTDVINKGNESERPLEIFQSFLGAVEDGAATGPLADVERWSMSLGAMLGVDSAVASAAANDLVSVLQGNITLAEASALKGALSDKDLKFLQESLPSYKQSEQGLKDVLAYLASSKAAEVYAGKQFAARMAKDDFSGKTAIKSLNAKTALESVSKYNYLVRQRALGKYKGRIPIPTASEIAQWAKFTDQPEGTAQALIEAIKLREEGA
jgi:hypothetical protein